MTEDDFWKLIERSRSTGPREQMKSIEQELRSGGASEVVEFSEHVGRCMDVLYTWDLWAVAYIIDHGCSDDSFDDFRSCVISAGREMFDLALTDPAAFGMRFEEGLCLIRCDMLQFIADQMHRELTGDGCPPRSTPGRIRPSGEDWEEDDLPVRFPEVWAKWA